MSNQDAGTRESRAIQILENLTPAQAEAVTHIDGPMLILAGPGSGKTRVITHRIAHMIEKGVSPYQILALTFTNKAADEMRARLERLTPGKKIWAGTFHAFCARMLRDHAGMIGLTENFSIYDTDEQKKAINQAIKLLDIDLFRFTPDQVLSEISRAKNNLVKAEDYAFGVGDPIRHITGQVYPAYQQILQDSNAVDFDDLLSHVAHLLRENPEVRQTCDERFQYILVDEYQDTNFAQYAIVRALSINYPNLAVTGDPDQSIYGWRGANLNNILSFEQDYPNVKVVRLEQNYRSTKCILRVADALIEKNVHRKAKRLFTENEEGDQVKYVTYPSEQDEAEDIAEQIAVQLEQGDSKPSDFAIFYRVNAMSRQLERSLRSRGIPYQIVKGTEFFHRKEVKDIVAYLLLVNNPRHNVAFERIVNEPPRKIGKVTQDRLQAFALSNRLPFLEVAASAGQVPKLQKKTVGILARFAEMIERIQKQLTLPLPSLVELVLQETGYREHLMLQDTPEADERLANLDELVNAAAEFSARFESEPTLDEFLQEVALVADTDAWESQSERVTLMTLHAAKGLEFPNVHIVGLEQGVLPHRRAIEDDERQIEEERRLLFVGITRAEKQLSISRAQNRMRSGRPWPTVTSIFAMELPSDDVEYLGLGKPSAGPYGNSWEQRLDSGDPFAQEAAAWEHEPVIRDDASFDFQSAKPASKSNSEAGFESETFVDPAMSRRVPASVFREGMLVNHPEYGTGTIISITGSGSRRSAKVEFYSDDPQTFYLAHSPLVPAEPD